MKYLSYEYALSIADEEMDRADWHRFSKMYCEAEVEDISKFRQIDGEPLARFPLALRDILRRDNSIRYIRNSLDSILMKEAEKEELYQYMKTDLLNGYEYCEIEDLARYFKGIVLEDYKRGDFDAILPDPKQTSWSDERLSNFMQS